MIILKEIEVSPFIICIMIKILDLQRKIENKNYKDYAVRL